MNVTNLCFWPWKVTQQDKEDLVENTKASPGSESLKVEWKTVFEASHRLHSPRGAFCI